MREVLKPLFDRLVVKELDRNEVRDSGLVVPDFNHNGPPQTGMVLAVGPGLDWWAQAGVEVPVAVGDKVMFPQSAGIYIDVAEERLLVLRLGELLGVLADA